MPGAKPPPAEARTALVGGVYRPPAVQLGDWLDDAIDGRVEVGGYSNGPIPWPRRLQTGRSSLILCGDLVRAVRTESAVAIAHHFGVGTVTVSKWRVALGVDRRNNQGTRTLYRTNGGRRLIVDQASHGDASVAPSIVRSRAADLDDADRPDAPSGFPAEGARPSDLDRRAVSERQDAEAPPPLERAPNDEYSLAMPRPISGTALTSAQRKKFMRQRNAARGERRVSVDLSKEAREKADRCSSSAGLTRTEWVNQLILQHEV